MKRLLVLIAMLFTFANMAGSVLAHSHRYVVDVAQPLVVLNHVDEDNRPIPVVVKIQPCGHIDLGNGLVLSCGSHLAIAPDVPQLPKTEGEDHHVLMVDETAPAGTRLSILRPPRHG
ncbi:MULTISPECIES: hypothetical protein [unclassified Devosia]|uniref:hypothetical protein n=1 Tax=unclassified Devosia TaxID=196773 RepID=UPI00145D11BE|nr:MULTISPECIES: hypothetical protein [unclassified Devosia]MBJ7577390.1 hypothetical protein [Devosia sp. MC532]MBK1795209.1 hypothetical protein [Devosia sp. WQ 349K1]